MLLMTQSPRKYTKTLAVIRLAIHHAMTVQRMIDAHILNPRKVSSVMGCELSRQLREPGVAC